MYTRASVVYVYIPVSKSVCSRVCTKVPVSMVCIHIGACNRMCDHVCVCVHAEMPVSVQGECVHVCVSQPSGPSFIVGEGVSAGCGISLEAEGKRVTA